MIVTNIYFEYSTPLHMVQEVVGPMHSQQQHYLLLSSLTLQP